MRYKFLNSFEGSLQKLSFEEKKLVSNSMRQLIDAFQAQTIPPGLGLKKLSSSLWELRAGLKLRVLFVLEKDLVKWSIVGRHNDIRRFIKNHR